MHLNYGVLPYKYIRIGNDYLIISDYGSWCFLNEEEFKKLENNKIDDEIKIKLEKEKIIASKNNINQIIADYKNLNRFLFQGPSLHIVIPTLKCNQNCVYCQAKPKNDINLFMTKETAIKVLDFIFKSPSQAITIEFQGGEPLLNWDVVKFIVEEARKINNEFEKKDLRISMVTNLTLMDDEKLDFLIKNNVSICTSLDGPKYVHDKNRIYLENKGTYDDVIKWIKKINKEYKKRNVKMKLNAIATITKQSLPYWKEIVDEYVKDGFNTIPLGFVNKMGSAKRNWNEIGYSPEEFIEFWKKAMNYIIELNRKGINIKERLSIYMLTKIFDKVDPGYTELMSPCGAGRTQIVYNTNGDIYTCDEGRMLEEDLFKLGNVENKYEDIMRNDNLIAICHSSLLDNYCTLCAFKPFCGTCPVANYNEQGTIIPKITETFRCKVYKELFIYIYSKIRNPEIAEIFKRWIL